MSDAKTTLEPDATAQQNSSTDLAQPATSSEVADQTVNPAQPESQSQPGPSSSSSIQVFSAPSGSTSQPKTPSEVDEGFFEPSLSDVQSYHATVVSRSKRLNEAPLLTSKHRDEDRQTRDKKKAEKWPNTTIRVKFSDGTQIQSSFPSSSAIQPVYAFVREALQPEIAEKPFTLWQPPRFAYPEHPKPAPTTKAKNTYAKPIIPPANYGHVRGGPTAGLMGGTGGKETLGELGLVPQSMLLVKWDDEAMNATGYPAPLKAELMEKVVPLPAPAPPTGAKTAAPSGASTGDAPKEKKIPKWLQKGLMKKK